MQLLKVAILWAHFALITQGKYLAKSKAEQGQEISDLLRILSRKMQQDGDLTETQDNSLAQDHQSKRLTDTIPARKSGKEDCAHPPCFRHLRQDNRIPASKMDKGAAAPPPGLDSRPDSGTFFNGQGNIITCLKRGIMYAF